MKNLLKVKPLIQKHQLKNGKGTGKLTIQFTPEQMTAIEANMLNTVPGTNVNSNRTVGETARRAGAEATRTRLRENYKRDKRRNVGEMHTYVASKERQDPITGEPVIIETTDVGSNGSGAMSGRDPLLGTIFDLYTGTKAWNSGAKLLLWGAGKYMPSTMLGLWGRTGIINDVARRSFNLGGWGQVAARPIEETSLFYRGTPQSESGLTSLKFFERPSRISKRERLGIPKGENYYTPELNKAFLKQINDFAKKYGYGILEDKEYGSELLNSYARALIDRHNKFYRGVAFPVGEDLDLVKKTLGNEATNELILLHVATHSRGEGMSPELYISPTTNAFSYGANGRTAIISRPYKLGKDRTKWFDEGDFNIVETGTVNPKSYNDFLGLVYPWSSPRFLTYNPFLGKKIIPEYYSLLTPLEIIEGEGYYEYIPNPYVQNELISINNPMIFRLWVKNPTLETLSKKTPDVPWQLSKITVRKQGGKMFRFKKGNKIHIKKANRGKFTDYCGGEVTNECILRGKHSSNPAVRKRATFAANARKWKHKEGGIVKADNGIKFTLNDGLALGSLLIGNIANSIQQNKFIDSLIKANKALNKYLQSQIWNNSLSKAKDYYTKQFEENQKKFNSGESFDNPSLIVAAHSAWDMASRDANNLISNLNNQLQLDNLQLQQQKKSILGSALGTTGLFAMNYLT